MASHGSSWFSLRWLAFILILCWCVGGIPSGAEAQRAIPDDNLAYPVLIQRLDGAASGFYLNTATSMYLVTAKHVLFDPENNKLRSPQLVLTSYPRDPKDSGRNILLVDLLALWLAGEVKAH